MQTELYTLPPSWTTSIQCWVDWLTTAGMSAETIKLRRSHLRMVARRTATLRPSDVTLDQLVEMSAAHDWSNEHRRSVRAALDGFYRWAIGVGACTDNPATKLPKVPESKPRPRPVPDDIWADLLTHAGDRERLMIRLAGEAGLRRAEVARCHRRDLVQDLYGWSLIVTGKGDKQRTVPLTDGLAAAVQAHTGAGYLFPGPDGHLSAGWVGTTISRLMPDGWSIHKLRHRYASRGYAKTGDLLAVQQALGHASPATTQRYVQVPSAAVRAVSEAAA